MIEPIALEVLLTPRKKVVSENSQETLDVLLRLRAHESQNLNLTRTPLAISIVIDRSGSMSGGKLEEAKKAAIDLINRLHDEDLVSIVVYDSRMNTLMELMPAAMAKSIVVEKMFRLNSGGATNLHGGWLKGAELLAPHANSKKLCRVILLSDGQANEGIVRIDEITRQVTELAQAGISTTTVGIGLGFNEELMTAIAQAGQGNAWYGERVEDLMESFDSEMSYLTQLSCKEVEVIAHYDGRYLKMRNDYPNTRPNAWKLSGIAVGSEKWMAFSMPMREVIHIQSSGEIIEIELKVTDTNGGIYRLSAKLQSLPVVSGAEYRDAPEDELVARRFQEVEIADMQREARALVGDRDWVGLERMIDQLELRAHNNPWLLETIRYMRTLMERRDVERMQKEFSYSSHYIKNRSTEIDEGVLYNMSFEATKPAFLRKKSAQGRNSDSQS